MSEKAELQRQIAELTRELETVREELKRLAAVDALTGVASRRVMDERLAAEAARVHRYGGVVSLVFADIDGESPGEEVMRSMGRLLRGSVRETDLVARYNAELFAIMLPHTAAKDARLFVERLRRVLASQPELPAGGRVTMSFGIAEHSVGKEPSKLVAAAAAALDQAKAGVNKDL